VGLVGFVGPSDVPALPLEQAASPEVKVTAATARMNLR
jgi:hypothetical protein